MKLALVRITTGEVIKVMDSERPSLELPDSAGMVSPLVAGWEGGGELIKGKENWSTGQARFRLIEVEEAVIPDGFEKTASTMELRGGKVVEVPQTRPIVKAPTLPIADRLLNSTGITLEELRDALNKRG